MSSAKKTQYYSPAPTISTKASMNRSQVGNLGNLFSSPKSGERQVSYVPTFFQEGRDRGTGSPTPFVGGRRDQNFVNPTFTNSSDFFNAPQRHNSIPVNSTPVRSIPLNDQVSPRSSVGNNTPTPKSAVPIADDNVSVASHRTGTSIGSRKSSLSGLSSTPKSNFDAQRNAASHRKCNSIDTSSRASTSISNRNSDPWYATSTKTGYQSPSAKAPEVDPNNFFTPLNAANKEIMREKQQTRQQEFEIQQGLDDKMRSLNDKKRAIDAQNIQMKKDTLKGILHTNVQIFKEKRELYGNKTKEDLSSTVEIHAKPGLKEFLDQTNAQRSVLDRVADDASNLYEARMNGIQNVCEHNKQKDTEQRMFRDMQKRVDLQQEGISKIGQPEIYQPLKPEEQAARDLSIFVSPRGLNRSTSRTNNSSSSGKEKSLNVSQSYVDMVKNAYSHYNPEVQRKREDKLDEFKMKEAYEVLSKERGTTNLPYSTVSKYLKEQSKSHVKY